MKKAVTEKIRKLVDRVGWRLAKQDKELGAIIRAMFEEQKSFTDKIES